jgi:uncharacterized protein (TIGR02001 family)
MKKMALVALLALSAAAPLAASAQQPVRRSDWSMSGNMSFVSDYRFRGISQTYRLPAVQGGFDLGHSAGFYVGTWASNVSGNQFIGGNSMEWDFYGGYKFEVARNVALDLGVLYYYYPGAKVQLLGLPANPKRYDTTEFYAAATLWGLIAKLNYSVSDFFGANDSSGSWYADLSYTYPVTKTVNLVAHVGRQDIKNFSNGNYTDYKLGVTAEAAGLTWGLSFIGTNARETAYTVSSLNDGSAKVVSKNTGVFSVGKTF